MATARRNHLTTDYIRSPFISERRRKLFPAGDHHQDVDSELGHISPIHSSESSDDSEIERREPVIRGRDTPLSNRTYSETMSPLKLSPSVGRNGFLRETPRKFSPSQSLKTPHDTSTKPVLEKEQKALLEESKSLKRKASLDGSSPELNKNFKSSKVRTALFPAESPAEDKGLPTKSFYSTKAPDNVLEKSGWHKERLMSFNKPVKLSVIRHRPINNRRLRGQINKGVRHKIRKPKQGKISKSAIAQATKKILETGPALNEYIRDLSELKNKQNAPQRLIEHPSGDAVLVSREEQIASEENKENLNESQQIPSVSPIDDKKAKRKFFKASRTKPIIVESNNVPSTTTIITVQNDFEEDDAADQSQPNIDRIISVLSSAVSPQNDDVITSSNNVVFNDFTDNKNTVVLEAHPSVTASENSIQLHQPAINVANAILSPISQMCDVTSGLALNSPRKRQPLTNVSRASKMLSFNGDYCSFVDNNMEANKQQDKLFPVFYKGAPAQVERGEKRERNDAVKRSAKRFKALAPDQMLLDAGQKRFGLTLCSECDIVYHMGDPNDEIQHSVYHNAQHVLRFGGWKNEHVMANFYAKGRIIRVLPTDSKIWIKKVKDLMGVVIRDLGCYEMEYDISQSQVYLYIKNRTIAGCAVASNPQGPGHRMLSSLSGVAMCSQESYPIKCGVSYIWVAPNFRKQGIASALMDAIKNNFAYDSLLSNDDIALTSPTEAGSAFAEKYFRTPNYLIYYT